MKTHGFEVLKLHRFGYGNGPTFIEFKRVNLMDFRMFFYQPSVIFCDKIQLFLLVYLVISSHVLSNKIHDLSIQQWM